MLMGYSPYMGIGFVNRFNRDEMNKITNDYGDEVIAVGREGSNARIRCEYPKNIKRIFDKMVNLYIMNSRYTYFDMNEMMNYISSYVPLYIQMQIPFIAYEDFKKWLTTQSDLAPQ